MKAKVTALILGILMLFSALPAFAADPMPTLQSYIDAAVAQSPDNMVYVVLPSNTVVSSATTIPINVKVYVGPGVTLYVNAQLTVYGQLTSYYSSNPLLGGINIVVGTGGSIIQGTVGGGIGYPSTGSSIFNPIDGRYYYYNTTDGRYTYYDPLTGRYYYYSPADGKYYYYNPTDGKYYYYSYTDGKFYVGSAPTPGQNPGQGVYNPVDGKYYTYNSTEGRYVYYDTANGRTYYYVPSDGTYYYYSVSEGKYYYYNYTDRKFYSGGVTPGDTTGNAYYYYNPADGKYYYYNPIDGRYYPVGSTGYIINPIVCDAPVASINSGALVDEGAVVTLSTRTPGATIYYSTDGTAPSARSIKYTGPIVIKSDVTIRAVAVGPSAYYYPSVISQFTYMVKKYYSLGVFSDISNYTGLEKSLDVLLEQKVIEKTSKFNPSGTVSWSDVESWFGKLGIDVAAAKIDASKLFADKNKLTYEDMILACYKIMRAEKIIAAPRKQGTVTIKTLTYNSEITNTALYKAAYCSFIENKVLYKYDFRPQNDASRAYLAVAVAWAANHL